MFDVNPLGPMMHLKQLERQAISAARHDTGKVRMLGEELMARLWRILTSRNGIARHKEV